MTDRLREIVAAVRTAWEGAGGSFRVREPADGDALAAWERVIGRPLPPDLRELYGIADGEAGGFGLFFGWEWLPARVAAEAYEEVSGLRNAIGEDEVIFDRYPWGAIRRVAWSAGWVPFAHDGSGNFLAVDLDPGPAGRVGQVIVVGRDHVGEPGLLGPSPAAVLEEIFRALRAGEFTLDRDQVPPFLELPWPGVVDRPRDPVAAARKIVPPPEWRSVLGGNTDCDRLATWERLTTRGRRVSTLAPVAYMRDLQELTVLVTPATDLGPLAKLHRLLALSIEGPATLDLGPIRGLPVECLTLAGIDLPSADPLTALPALRVLALTGSRVPVLPSLPQVVRVDVTRCVLGAIAGFGAATRTVIAAEVRNADATLVGDEVVRAVAAAPGVHRLDVSGAGVTAIERLAGHPALRDLDLSGNPIPGLEALTTLSLGRLTLDFGQWRKLRPVLHRLRVEAPIVAEGRDDESRQVREWLADAGVVRRRTDSGHIDLGQ